MKSLNQYIDHTLLKPTATALNIAQLCAEAMEREFYAVCVNGCYTAFAKAELFQSPVKIATVIGFPLGASSTSAKVYETQDALQNGADEIDMVISIADLKSGNYISAEHEIQKVRRASEGLVLKVILENCYLSTEEKQIACRICKDAGVDFIKTSTGFGTGGATIEDVKLMRTEVGDSVKIKASGGIKDRKIALEYIELGVNRIGTSSGLKIVKS